MTFVSSDLSSGSCKYNTQSAEVLVLSACENDMDSQGGRGRVKFILTCVSRRVSPGTKNATLQDDKIS